MEDALDISFFKKFDFDFAVLPPTASHRSYEPINLKNKIRRILRHLSQMIGNDICQYTTPFQSENDGSYFSSSAHSDENSNFILFALPSSENIEKKWVNAFIPLIPFQPTWTLKETPTKLKNLNSSTIHKSAARREATFKRRREGNGKFKSCVTKWVTATEFSKRSSQYKYP